MTTKKKIIVVDTEDDDVFVSTTNTSASGMYVGANYSSVLLGAGKSIDGEIVMSLTVQGEVSDDDLETVLESYKSGMLDSIEGDSL